MSWFDLEIRMRKLIYELLQPNIVNQNNDRDRLDQLTKLVQETHNSRLIKIEYALFKQNSTPTVFDTIFKRFTTIDIMHHEDKAELEAEIDDIRLYTKDFRFLVETNDQKIINLDKKIEDLKLALADAVSELKLTRIEIMNQLNSDVKRINDRTEGVQREVLQLQHDQRQT